MTTRYNRFFDRFLRCSLSIGLIVVLNSCSYFSTSKQTTHHSIASNKSQQEVAPKDEVVELLIEETATIPPTETTIASTPIASIENSLQSEVSSSALPIVTSTPNPKLFGKQPERDQAQSWYYMKRGKGNVPRFPITAWFKTEQHVKWVGQGKKVYLTFDNGADMGDIDRLIAALDNYQVKATFFITGTNMKKHPDEIKRLIADGQMVCNHSYTHHDFTAMTDEQILKELHDTEAVYEEITGEQGPKYFRYPYGKFTSHTLDLIATEGYTTVFWSTAMKDWLPRKNGAIDAYNDVMNNLHDGNVILMHQGSKDNVDALENILKTVIDAGYEFELMDKL